MYPFISNRAAMFVRAALTGCIVAAVVILAGCSDDSPTKPDDQTIERLAGGGRANNTDPFSGGREGSGPNDSLPGIPPIEPGDQYLPLFYSDFVCIETPSYRLISDSAAWYDWWQEATECWFDSSTGRGAPRFGYAHLGDDTDWVDPDSVPSDTTFPEPWGPPAVDFEQDVVVVIALEPTAIPGRYLWLKEVTSGSSGSSVHYEVMIPGEDCYRPPVDSFPDSLYMYESAPTAAFLVPRPVSEPIDWQRTETVYNCTWQPDPQQPLMLYYTDAPCDLGSSEQIITNQDDFKRWVDKALECDFNRWYDPNDTIIWKDSTGVPGGGGIMIPNIGIDVDFTTHAVIILRADELTRWGGGVWLNEFTVSDAGTNIDYSVMQPGDDCPEVDDGTVQPTVAIRVPLPLNQPISWNRRVENIACDWGDSTIIVGGGR